MSLRGWVLLGLLGMEASHCMSLRDWVRLELLGQEAGRRKSLMGWVHLYIVFNMTAVVRFFDIVQDQYLIFIHG